MNHQQIVVPFTRKEVEADALRIAKSLRSFIQYADQFLSIQMRENLRETAKELEHLAND